MNKQTESIAMTNQLVVITPNDLSQILRAAVRDELAAAEAERTAESEKQLPELMTRNQAAELLNCSVGTIDNYIREGWLTKQKIGSHAVRISREELEKLARRV